MQFSLTARRQTVRPYLVSGGPFVSAMTVVLIDRWPGLSVVSPINHAIESRAVNSLQASPKQQRLRSGDSLFPTSATERIDRRFTFRVRGTSSLEGLHESLSALCEQATWQNVIALLPIESVKLKKKDTIHAHI